MSLKQCLAEIFHVQVTVYCSCSYIVQVSFGLPLYLWQHTCMISHLCALHTGATAHSGAYFGEGSDPIHLSDVKCSGSEYDVAECTTKNAGINSSHSLDVGVKCQPGILNCWYTIANQCCCVFFSSQMMKLTEGEIFV